MLLHWTIIGLGILSIWTVGIYMARLVQRSFARSAQYMRLEQEDLNGEAHVSSDKSDNRSRDAYSDLARIRIA